MEDRLHPNEKVQFVWNSVVTDVLDADKGEVTGVRLKDAPSGEETVRACDGVFIGIGHSPNTALFRGQLEMNEVGYLKTHDGAKTSISGAFAAGDVQDHIYRQAVTTAGTGCRAAMAAARLLQTEH